MRKDELNATKSNIVNFPKQSFYITYLIFIFSWLAIFYQIHISKTTSFFFIEGSKTSQTIQVWQRL